MRKYITELIGTFFLVITVCGTVMSKAPLAPVAIGAVLAAMIFAGGHISGAHYNPAVTLAVFLRGRLAARDVLPYMGAQIIGGSAAAAIARLMFTVPPPTAFHASGGQLLAAFSAELLMTFALAYVVLSVATTVHHPDNSFYGLAIGFTVMAGAVTMGGVSGGAFNPAVAVGISIAGLVTWAMLPIYFVATLVGGGLAAVAFRALNPNHAASSDTPDGPPEASDRQSANGARRTGAGRVKV
jgi:aquaporin Z